MHTIPVGVLGASGYAGHQLCSLIQRHPSLSLKFATAHDQRGTTARIDGQTIPLLAPDDAKLGEAEIVFSALPHGSSHEWVTRARQAGARVVDLSADLRPGSGVDGAAYGLTELSRTQVAGAGIVANPGCYPTSVLLALAPLFAQALVLEGSTITINSASGVSGAGRSPRRELMFAEVSEDYRAYGVGNTHSHLSEMRAFTRSMGADVDLVFTPHLLPVARGILSTITVPIKAPLDDVLQPWRDAYSDEPFVELASDPPTLREVVHRNVIRIAVIALRETRVPTLLVLSALDNLMKGAAGQAIQNANLMLGLAECAGLPA
ncbi:MAG: N-acetyl-gamma-glutamyl-phosphate reductase [Anaerolineae bacterium]|nr:N-acetyl-gamma-glutamyl-phosphate reductase [Gemmatimonadaceae bacterium]